MSRQGMSPDEADDFISEYGSSVTPQQIWNEHHNELRDNEAQEATMTDIVMTAEEFRHILINTNDRGFDDRLLKAPVTVPASANEHGEPNDRVCNDFGAIFWDAFLGAYRDKAFPNMEEVTDYMDSYYVNDESTLEDAEGTAFPQEWPVEQNVGNLEIVYEYALKDPRIAK